MFFVKVGLCQQTNTITLKTQRCPIPMSTTIIDHETLEPWVEVVRQKVAAIRFGSVQITVHEGRVTQVESLEKTRFNANDDDSLAAARKARR